MKNQADIELRTSQIMYPTIHYSRMKCLDSMMTSSNFIWNKGVLIPRYSLDNYTETRLLASKNISISLDDALWKKLLQDAQKEVSKRTEDSYETKTAAALADIYKRMTLESAAIPPVYRISTSSVRVPINSIPDDIDSDFLDLCIEYLNQVSVAKTDFTEKTILTPSDQRLHFGEKATGLSKSEVSSRQALSEEIGKMLAETSGKPWPPSKEQLEKDKEEWDKFYSPAARANRANKDNEEARKTAISILENLKARKLIPYG